MIRLKSAVLLFICFTFSASTIAQQKDTVAQKQPGNILKINLSALVVKNISIQYERKVSKRVAIAANVHYIPFGKLPFLPSIEKAIDDPSVPVDQLKLGSFGVTPEVRFYVGRKGALRGFYLAPFINYTNYKTDLPINYLNDLKTGIFKGNIATITGGLLLGAQWQLGKKLYLDWWIIGPNYGSCKGDLNLNATLNALEQADLRDQLEELKADEPFDKIIETYEVNSTGAYIKAKGPWGGLRGLGINLGIRF